MLIESYEHYHHLYMYKGIPTNHWSESCSGHQLTKDQFYDIHAKIMLKSRMLADDITKKQLAYICVKEILNSKLIKQDTTAFLSEIVSQLLRSYLDQGEITEIRKLANKGIFPVSDRSFQELLKERLIKSIRAQKVTSKGVMQTISSTRKNQYGR